MIAVNNISKTYIQSKDKINALRGISFSVDKGEIFGLIGPDGAGKSTLIRILTTLLLADEGQAYVDGKNVVDDFHYIRKNVGYMPGKFSLYQDLSVEENLQFFAAIFNTTIQQNYSLIEDIYIQLEPFKDRRAGNLSGGMKQKLALCCALIHKPIVLFLDEPTTGVDAVSRKEFWIMLKRLKLQGITILVSTPYMDEASMCDRVGLIQGGKMLSVNKPEELTKSFPELIYAIKSEHTRGMLSDVRQYPHTISCEPFGEYNHAVFSKKGFNESDFFRYLESKGHMQTGIKFMKVEPGIEDCFIYLMNQN